MKLLVFITAFLALALTGCGTSSKNYSDVAIETHGFYGPWGDKHMPLVVIDAGHGGFDLGACHASCEEKDLALTTSLLLKRYLNEKGYRVILTRNRDVFIPLKERAAMANEAKSKLFVSIHYNAAQSTNAEGIEVYYFNKGDHLRIESSKKLASDVLSKLLHRTGAPSRGIKHGNFLVIRETKMPAILIEGGFITSPKERAILKSRDYQEEIAQAVAEGIDHYFKI
ncbi:MAG: N-acetylmuramoyl-L-alanine amidase [Chlamydiia bacterium]|nr:N-acetylmuramoyl-L-alanine amidase [Chlamydiia bacterium]HPE84708.1 N-acetylmuramoyl-L-alanine amidase [Chlamydiales bacterium]